MVDDICEPYVICMESSNNFQKLKIYSFSNFNHYTKRGKFVVKSFVVLCFVVTGKRKICFLSWKKELAYNKMMSHIERIIHPKVKQRNCN